MKTLEHIRKKGSRVTKPRERIINALTTLSKPVTVKEIFGYLQKKHVKVDLASIYRTLHLLSEIGIVHVFEFGEGKKRFELMSEQKHHHHFVCDGCGSINEISVSEEQFLIHEIKRQTEFDIKRHTLEFFGYCKNCR